MVGRRLSALVDLWGRNSLVTDGFSSQRDSNTELCRFCISLSIVLNKHSCCVATNTERIQTHCVPRLHGGRFADDIFGCISLNENVHDLILYPMQWFCLYMNGITNIEDAMISGIVHSVVHIWYDRLGPFDKQDWRNMSTEGRWLLWYAGGCVKPRVPAVGCDRLGPFNTRDSEIWLTMADDILKDIYWNTIFSN